jgi:nitrogen-specific signal transduction histidine kinase
MHRKRKSLEGPGEGVNEAVRDLASGDAGGWPALAAWARDAAGADHVLVLLRFPGPDGAGQEPLAAAAKTDLDGVADRPRLFAYARALAGWVSRTRDLVTVTDAGDDPRFPDAPDGVRAALAVPVQGTGDGRGAVVALYAGDLPRDGKGSTAEGDLRVPAAEDAPRVTAAGGDPRAAANEQVLDIPAAERVLRTAAAVASLVADREAMTAEARDRAGRMDAAENELTSARRWAAVGRMALDIAEELKLPLAGLGTAVQRLRDAVAASEPDHPLLDVVSQEIEHLNRLVAEQIELGNSGDPRLGPEDVNRLLRECVELVGSDLGAGKVKVTQRMGANLPHLLLDTDLMRRVFLNLLRTAITHAAPGGRIKVQSKRAGERVAVQITADGPRDPGQSLENLWKPFMGRPGGSVSSESIQRILRDHRAVLTVSTTPDWPLVFELSLPIADNQDRRRAAPDRRAGGDRRRG